MKGTTWLVLGAALFSGSIAWAAPNFLVVTVVNKNNEPALPVPKARVTLSYFDGSEKITEARNRTNRKGQTELTVSADAQERGDLRIEISDAPGLVVYQPPEGLVAAVRSPIVVMVLPKGSPALLDPAQIQAMVDRLSRQVQRLKVSVSMAENRKPDFDRDLREWAAANGLPYEEVNQRVRTWAQDLRSSRRSNRSKLSSGSALRNWIAKNGLPPVFS